MSNDQRISAVYEYSLQVFFVDSKSHTEFHILGTYSNSFQNVFIISFHFKMIMRRDKQSVMNDQQLVNNFALFKYFFVETCKL